SIRHQKVTPIWNYNKLFRVGNWVCWPFFLFLTYYGSFYSRGWCSCISSTRNGCSCALYSKGKYGESIWSYWIDSSDGRRSRSSDWWNDSPLYSLVLSSTHSYDNNYHCSVSYEIIKERSKDKRSF